MRSIKLKHNRQTGTTSIEYAMLASLIAVVIVSSAAALGGNLDAVYKSIATSLEVASNGSVSEEQRLSTGKRIDSAMDDAAGITPDQSETQKAQETQGNSILQQVLSLFR